MTSDLDLRGVWVPLITPFDASGAVDVDAIERLCREYLAAGAPGIVALGTTGEATALDDDEKRAVIDACSRVCVERGAPLIVGTGTNNTRTTIAATQALAGVPGVVGALVVVPYYVRPSEAGDRRALPGGRRRRARFRSSPTTSRTAPAAGSGAASLLELAAHPEHRGREAGGRRARRRHARGARRRARAASRVLGGEDALAVPDRVHGRRRRRSRRRRTCAPARFVAMIECGLAGKLEDGRAHAEALLPVVQAGFAEPNPAVFKGVLHAQGRIATPDLRLPLANAVGSAVDRRAASPADRRAPSH